MGTSAGVLATSDVGDLVFEPFLGSGTMYDLALKHNRRFIGADISLNLLLRFLKQKQSPEVSSFTLSSHLNLTFRVEPLRNEELETKEITPPDCSFYDHAAGPTKDDVHLLKNIEWHHHGHRRDGDKNGVNQLMSDEKFFLKS